MSSDWVIRKQARLLQPGERFIFSGDMGGEDEPVTVVSVTIDPLFFGIAIIETEEFDFGIQVMAWRWVEMVT